MEYHIEGGVLYREVEYHIGAEYHKEGRSTIEVAYHIEVEYHTEGWSTI